jgi:hypothetical protein
LMNYTHEAMARSFSALLDAHCQRQPAASSSDPMAEFSGMGTGMGNHSVR